MTRDRRFYRLTSLVLLAFAATIALAQGSWKGTQLIATPQDDWPMDIQLGQSGQIGIVGWTRGSLGSQTSLGGKDAFITVLDSSGKTRWTQQFGSKNIDTAFSLKADANGEWYVCGETNRILDRTDAGDGFLAKFSRDGKQLWFKTFGSPLNDTALGLDLDASGNVIVAGDTLGVFDGQRSAGQTDLFVAKFSPDGRQLWTRQFGSRSPDEFEGGIALDAQGNIVVGGASDGAFPKETGEGRMFVTKFDPTGQVVWLQRYGAPEILSQDKTDVDYLFDLTVDAQGRIWAVGYTSGDLKPGAFRGDDDAFLMRLSTDGKLEFVDQFGSKSYEASYGVTIDQAGNVIVTGYTFLGGVFEGTPFVPTYPNNSKESLLVKYDPSGKRLWWQQYGSPNEDDEARQVTTDTDGNIFVIGLTEGDIDAQSAQGGYDTYVMKFSSDGQKF
jgi:hypothetical protein